MASEPLQRTKKAALPPWVFVPPPRHPKLRRRPITSRERGLEPVFCNGLFALPMKAFDSVDPIELQLNKDSVMLYNLAFSIKALQSECEAVTGDRSQYFHRAAACLNRQVSDIRSHCAHMREYLIEAGCKTINEPCALKRI